MGFFVCLFFGGGGREGKGFYMQIASCRWGWGWRGLTTDYLTGADQKIPDWLIKIMFLGKVETAVRSSMKSRFGIMGF